MEDLSTMLIWIWFICPEHKVSTYLTCLLLSGCSFLETSNLNDASCTVHCATQFKYGCNCCTRPVGPIFDTSVTLIAWKCEAMNIHTELMRCTLFETFEKQAKWRIGMIEFWHFPQFIVQLKLTYPVTLSDLKLKKPRQNGLFLAFSINFCPFKM